MFPSWLKIVLLLFAAFLLYAAASTTSPETGGLFARANTLPLILALIALLGAAYHERWIFDRKAGRVLYQFGLIFLHSNRVIELASLEEVKISRFVKGRLTDRQESGRSFWQRRIITLSLSDREGKVYRLETYQHGSVERVEQTARAIADYCGLRLTGRENESAD